MIRSFLSLSLLFSIALASHAPLHRAIHRARQVDAETTKATLAKRQGGAKFTFYQPGLGACGGYNGPGDFIVALNQAEWAGGAHCGNTITISYKGKSTQATIVDLCPGCEYHGLDLTPGLLRFLTSNSGEQMVFGDWHYGGGAPPPPPPPLPPPSTSTPKPTPTSTRSQLTSTSTSAATPTLNPMIAVPASGNVGGGVVAQLNLFFVQAGSLIWDASHLSGHQ
jgi:hypothetical protein